MAKRITEGSLVCTNRNVEGLGLVLKRIRDINQYAEFDLSESFAKLFDDDHPEYLFKSMESYILVSLRGDAIESINEQIVRNKPDVELAALQVFWNHNRAYSVTYSPRKRVKKAKVDFCLVHWTKAPSDYGSKPSNWYQKKKAVWMTTSSVKNK